MPIQYKGMLLECGYRVDLLFTNQLLVELKSVKQLTGIDEAQILTYLKLSGIRVGLLINFNVTRLKDGLRRFVV